MRLTKDEYYLNIAKAVSLRSTCLRRQYGCVIVKHDEIIATGYNGAPRGEENCCDIYKECPRKNSPHNVGTYNDCHSVHAEQNALLSAPRDKLIGSTVYLYGSENGKQIDAAPCLICERMLKNAAVGQIICSKADIPNTLPVYRGYVGNISYDKEDNIFYGNVVGVEDTALGYTEINDVLGYHGTTMEELEYAFHNCIDNYVDTLLPLFNGTTS